MGFCSTEIFHHLHSSQEHTRDLSTYTQLETPPSEDNRNTEQQVPPENNPGATDPVENADEESLPEHTTSSGVMSDPLPHTHALGQSVGQYVT